jgi:hypothetical protein
MATIRTAASCSQEPSWYEYGMSAPPLPPLAAHVVGAGVDGRTVAAALARRRATSGGRSGVVQLDRRALGSGAPGIVSRGSCSWT